MRNVKNMPIFFSDFCCKINLIYSDYSFDGITCIANNTSLALLWHG